MTRAHTTTARHIRARQPVLRIALSLALATLAIAVLPGQQPAPQQQSQPPVFRSSIEAVQMDVVVTDTDGKPVSGLTVDDFEVFENRVPQIITTFVPVNMPLERREPLPFDAESDVQTNEREYRHVYMIFIPSGFTVLGLQARLRARQFLTDYFGDNDLGAVFVLGSMRTQDGQDFTNSRRLLLEAVDRPTGGGGFRMAQDLWEHMELMARIPSGRKSVIFFMPPGDPYAIIDFRGGVRGIDAEYSHAAVAAASRANVSWYPIDPSGVVQFGSDKDVFAGMMGGFAHPGGNDYERTFERLVAETSTYYVLAFNSSIRRKEGRAIALEVRVKRPGLTVRSRSHFIEQLEYIKASMPPEPKRTPVEEALANPLATTGVTMRVNATAFRQSGRTSTVALAVEVDPETLRFTERNGRQLAAFEIRHVVTDARAKIYPEYRHSGRLDLDARSYERLTRSGIRMVSQFDLPQGRYQVRVASARGTRNGSVVYDLVVPDFTDDDFAMSGVALTALTATDAVTFRPDRNQREKQSAKGCRDRVCEAAVAFSSVLVPYATRAAASEKPLLSEVLPAPPVTTRAFTPSDTLALFTEVYDNQKPDRKDPPYAITLTATLHNAESIVFRQVSEERDAKATRRKSGGHGFTLKVPLAGIAPGTYVLRVEASSGRNEQHRVSRNIPVWVK